MIFHYLKEIECVYEYFLHGWISYQFFNISWIRVMSLSAFINIAGEKGIHVYDSQTLFHDNWAKIVDPYTVGGTKRVRIKLISFEDLQWNDNLFLRQCPFISHALLPIENGFFTTFQGRMLWRLWLRWLNMS